MRRRTALILLALTAGCTGPPGEPAWTRIDLPASAGAALHAAANCDGLFYLAGGIREEAGGTRPAAWTSKDAVTWEPVRFAPLPTSQYGPLNVISAVACAGGRVVMLGSAPGGAHGNLRISSWHRLPDGRMAENPAPFETFGGDTAVDVAHLAAGPGGFAIAGNRSTGAAAWLSPDGTEFTLFEDAPGLATGAGPRTVARDVVQLLDGRWMVVGGRGDRAAAWTSSDGHRWDLVAPRAGPDWSELQRAVRDGDDVVAVGPRGTSFGTWRLRAGTWTDEGSFGGAPTGVQSLAVVGGHLVVTGGGLWISGDGTDWQPRSTPETPVAATGRDSTLLVVTAGAAWRSAI
ncbi:hypothetical protein [Actinoplanes sp. GCM10030250]|uniref:hypothetical protein n=1 Tax=Actinoplanes sp. GCM10030250 TaxID=3273376 RepID=UPI003616E66E